MNFKYIQTSFCLSCHDSGFQEMEPEMVGIVSGSRSIAQALVDAAMKVVMICVCLC